VSCSRESRWKVKLVDSECETLNAFGVFISIQFAGVEAANALPSKGRSGPMT
jgi:hypothetical protein